MYTLSELFLTGIVCYFLGGFMADVQWYRAIQKELE